MIETKFKTNKTIILLALICSIFVIFIMMMLILNRTKIETFASSAEQLKKTYATTDVKTWDISATENDSVTATLDEKGVLTISGTGDMKIFMVNINIPWYSVIEQIKSVIVEEGVTSISIRWCPNLTNVQIPSSVTSIEELFGFTDCNNLISIIINEKNKHYSDDNGVLYNKDKTELIKYPQGKKEEKYTIQNTTTTIREKAFFNCNYLTSIDIPNSVKSIEDSAFEHCTSLTSIEIPSGISNIGYSLFYECNNLVSVKIPSSVKSIGDYSFDYCSSLASIEIPSGVESIGIEAFANCQNLTTIKIPSSVTHIYDDSFDGSYNIKILCTKDSYAKTYAEENNIPYEIISNTTDYRIDDLNYTISEIKPETTVEQLKQKLGREIYKITDKNGKDIQENEYVGTGFKVEMTNGTNYTAIVTGDPNGDGNVDFKDIITINKHRLNKSILTGEYIISSDVNEDGKADFRDMIKLNKYRLRKIAEL